MANSKLKKTFLILICTIVIGAVLIILFISPITKYLVEKYDEKYTGRQIKMDWVYVNPFTGYIHFSNIKIYELKSDSVFFSADGISVSIAMSKLLSKTYEISECTLNHPRGIIIQNKKEFNFNDLIEKFSSKENSDTTTAPVHFNILNVKINDGEFYFRDQLIPVNYFIKKINFESAGKRWDADTIAAKFSFLSGIGSGDVKGNFTINFKNLDYRSAIVVHKLDLNIIEQYLKDLANYGSFSANLDADLKVNGNFKDEENVTSKGMLAINDFHFGKNPKEDFASFNKLIMTMNEVSPKNHKYLFDSVLLSYPYFKYELYDYLDNLQNMFGAKGANVKGVKADPAKFNLIIEIADYIKVLSKNFFQSDYKINRLAIYKGDLKFNDFSASEKFSMSLNPLSIIADSIDKNHKRVNMFLKSGIKPYGNLAVSLSINPKDSSDFDLHFHFQKIPVPMFNPYIISYTSFPLDRGTIELNGAWKVRSGIIQSTNHLLVIDPRISKRIRNNDRKWIPMPLVMFFIRERGNVIDYEIPITGNLNNPKFHFRKVIFDLLKNIFIKPPSTPYIMNVRNTENEVEKSFKLKWEFRQNSLQPNEKKFVNKIADFLKENPQVSISIHPNEYAEKEKEYILFYEAKKKYFLLKNNKKNDSFNEGDSIEVDKMSAKNPLFVSYLNKHLSDKMLFTIQQKCNDFIGNNIVSAKYNQLLKQRENNFRNYFKENGTDNRIKIFADEKKIPYNGFSFYEIDYKSELPKYLSEAYQKMNELNNETPRNKYLKERKKISAGVE